MSEEDKITVEWTIFDLIDRYPQLSFSECKEVIGTLKAEYDARQGINFDVVDSVLERLFPDYFGV